VNIVNIYFREIFMTKKVTGATSGGSLTLAPPQCLALPLLMADASPPHAPRGHYHHGDLSQALKTLALALIATRGVEGFSMRQAAATLGVAPSAVYRHFADKSELLSALAHDGFDAMGALWAQRVAQLEPQLADNLVLLSLARFSAGADAYFQFGLDHPELFQLMFGPFGTGSANWVLRAAEQPNHPYAMLGQALDGLRDAPMITDTARARAEVSAFSAIHGLTCLMVSGVFKDLDDAQKWEQLELVKNNILGGLLARDQVQQFKAALGATLAPGMLGSPLPSAGA
jgi:AcrR family transcriptional regulator